MIKAYEACVDCSRKWQVQKVSDPRFEQLCRLGETLNSQGLYNLAEKVFQRIKGVKGVKTRNPKTSAEDLTGIKPYNFIASNLADCLEKQEKFSEAHTYRDELAKEAKELFGEAPTTAHHLYKLGLNKKRRIAKEAKSGRHSFANVNMKTDAEEVFASAWSILGKNNKTKSKLAADVSYHLAHIRMHYKSPATTSEWENIRDLAKQAEQLRSKHYNYDEEARYKAKQVLVSVLLLNIKQNLPEKELQELLREALQVLIVALDDIRKLPERLPPDHNLNIRYRNEFELSLMKARVHAELDEIDQAIEILQMLKKNETYRCLKLDRDVKDDPAYGRVLVELERALQRSTDPANIEEYKMIEQERSGHNMALTVKRTHFSELQQQFRNTEKPKLIDFTVRIDYLERGLTHPFQRINENYPLHILIEGVVNKIAMRPSTGFTPDQIEACKKKRSLEFLILVKESEGKELAFSSSFQELGIGNNDVLIARPRRPSEEDSSPNKDFDYCLQKPHRAGAGPRTFKYPQEGLETPNTSTIRDWNQRRAQQRNNYVRNQFKVGQTVKIEQDQTQGVITKNITENENDSPMFEVELENKELRYCCPHHLQHVNDQSSPENRNNQGSGTEAGTNMESYGADSEENNGASIEAMNMPLDGTEADSDWLRHIIELSKTDN